MTPSILVMGATGSVGRATVAALRDAGARPAALVRDPERGAQVLGAGMPLHVGDLHDEGSIAAALEGIDAVLLCSGNDPSMAAGQLTAVRAIAAGDVRRVVKISGSPVSVGPDSPARTGREHFAVEEALRALGREAVAVRPNAFMDNFLDQAPAIAHGALPGPDGRPCVSFVAARDIGRVAAAALLAERAPAPILEVTGPEALSLSDVAQIAGAALARPVVHHPLRDDDLRQGLLAMGRPAWLVDHVMELAALMRDPKAAEVTDTVERVAGAAPLTLGEFFVQHAAAFARAA
jgi:uncharacterized protein YbjT (DUF2867 family)